MECILARVFTRLINKRFVRSAIGNVCSVRRLGQDSNLQSSGYEPDEFTITLPRGSYYNYSKWDDTDQQPNLYPRISNLSQWASIQRNSELSLAFHTK